MLPKESQGLALARGFIVFIMPAVHSVMMYSNDIVKAGWLGIALGFFAEQPGAQLFMLQMGLFIGMGKQKTLKTILKRFVLLLAAGYLLNLLRLVLPYLWGGVPDMFLVHNNLPDNKFTPLYLFLIGDILQFAALGYLCCQVVHRLIKSIYYRIFLLLAFVFISPLAWTSQPDNVVPQFIFGLFNGHPPKVFFPFFPWVCYPLAGLIISQVWQRYHVFKISLWFLISAGLVVTGMAISSIEPSEWNQNLYRLGPGGTIYHLGAAIAWMVLLIFLSFKIKLNTFFSFLEWLSLHITPIYFIQWMVIMWMIPVFTYHGLNVTQTLLAMIVSTMISFCLASLFEKIKSRPT
ncbi:MAG TPA: hypothetical protein PKE30_02605 [Niabella sp.]|nr:hypothetical protein [Niabella sp.]